MQLDAYCSNREIIINIVQPLGVLLGIIVGYLFLFVLKTILKQFLMPNYSVYRQTGITLTQKVIKNTLRLFPQRNLPFVNFKNTAFGTFNGKTILFVSRSCPSPPAYLKTPFVHASQINEWSFDVQHRILIPPVLLYKIQ